MVVPEVLGEGLEREQEIWQTGLLPSVSLLWTVQKKRTRMYAAHMTSTSTPPSGILKHLQRSLQLEKILKDLTGSCGQLDRQ